MSVILNQNTDKFLVSYFNEPLPINWNKEFGRKAPLVIEIGFGTGEYLLECAKQNPDKNFVGIEINFELIKKTLKRIKNANITNVRLLKIHATIALEYLFAAQSITHIDSLFSFPWPKKRHHRHRLFKTDFLKMVNNRLEKEGTLRIVTDNKPYFSWILKQNQATGLTLKKNNIPAQFNTRFERKWQAQGQKLFFQALLTKTSHLRVPVKKTQAIPPMFCAHFDPKTYAPRSITGEKSIIFKKFRFDEKKKQGSQIIFTAEDPLLQGFAVSIKRCSKKWKIELNKNEKIIKTKLVKKSLLQMLKACEKN
ncbi:MAG: tRNA (guanosine(46)-N7)-methyltransferase TrmB [Candidatus Omnitrophota bacterium]